MADLIWTDAGPRSTLFDDVYFSAEDGLAESRAVFLAGCGLPEAWADRQRFVVGELGFGTGLNILALLALWSEHRPAGATLHAFSVEQSPLSHDDAVRALGLWPELAAVARRLLDRWPLGAGFRRIDWPDLGATLDLFHGEALEGLTRWDGQADAWFLDGFAPARNPEMWRPELLAAVAARSAPGARAATFTVAGDVRRGLQAAGFTVEKQPGFGRKRQRLEARLPGQAAAPIATPTVAIVGDGIAGVSVARPLMALGVKPTLISSPDRLAASGNPAALVSPRFDVGDDAGARLHRQAFARAIDLYTDAPDAILSRGLLQLAGRDRDAQRFARLANQPAGRFLLRAQSAEEVSATLGEPVEVSGLAVDDALVVEPQRIRQGWSASAVRIMAKVAGLEPGHTGWRLLNDAGETIVTADVVVLCTAMDTLPLRPDATLRPVRGQATHVGGESLATAVAWGGYAVPTKDGVLFGATHDRGDADAAVRSEDDQNNLQTVRARLPALTGRLERHAPQGFAGVRATTPDHLPVAGKLESGLFCLTGLGGRGFTTAPLLGEHLAAQILRLPSPLPADLAKAMRVR